MDALDRRIIGLLVDDGRMSVTELADSIHLSLSATSQRLRHLQDSGAIAGFGARLSPEAVGRPIDAIIDIALASGSPFSELDEHLLSIDDVVDAMHLTGPFDYQVRVRCRDIDDLDRLLRRLKEELDVRETSTRIVLHTVTGFPRQPALS
jgi:Lrp/AsnC family transcriptional regulator, leucine-responsive regulatory protein